MRNSRDNYQLHRYRNQRDCWEVTPTKPATKGDVSFMGKLIGKLWLGLLFVFAVIWGMWN